MRVTRASPDASFFQRVAGGPLWRACEWWAACIESFLHRPTIAHTHGPGNSDAVHIQLGSVTYHLRRQAGNAPAGSDMDSSRPGSCMALDGMHTSPAGGIA
jgi:hypothetical protein